MELQLQGRIDSNNAAQIEKDLAAKLAGTPDTTLVLDASELTYISSAGLRVLLRIRKTCPDMTIRDVCSEVYEILEMTGFTELMKVEKGYRRVSVEDAEIIGRGANGTIYRIDMDNVVKVYTHADALDEIRHEREVARLALILGIPTAISYDVVQVGECYGSVFELLNARSFTEILIAEPEKMDWCVQEYVNMMHRIHETLVPEGKLPDMKETAISWAEFLKEYLPEEASERLLSLIRNIPRDHHMIHGDYHTKNLVLQDDEVLLIDMDTLATGHPVFELASIYNAYVGFSESDPTVIQRFQGFDAETGRNFWRKFLASYLGTTEEARIREVEDKARILGYTRLIRRAIRRGESETPEGRCAIELWTRELLELLESVDSLVFAPWEIEIQATTSNLQTVQEFADLHLEQMHCPPRTQMRIDVAVEEIFANIANYAYTPGTGTATIRISPLKDPEGAEITFLDRGIPYDPLAKEDPDISLSAPERPVGGLGIYMTKKTMDEVSYEYRDGQNIFTMKKYW